MARDLPSDRPKFSPVHDMPMSPAERQAVAKAVRIASAGKAAQNRRDAARQQLAAKIRAGTYISPADLNRARAAGVNFGFSKGFVGRFSEDMLNAGLYTLPGLAKAGYGVVHDVGQVPRGDFDFNRTRSLGAQIGKSTYETVRHPLRHPGDTTLLGLAALSAGGSLAARASAVGKAVGLKETVKALAKKPQPPLRSVTLGDANAVGTYSKNPGRALVQQALDRRAVARAAAGKPEALNTRFGRFAARNRQIEEEAGQAAQRAVHHAGRKLTPGQNMALRAYLENTPLNERAATAFQELATAKTARERKRLHHELGLIEAARPYLTVDESGSVQLAKDFATPRKRVIKGASPKQFAAQSERVIRGGAKRERQGVELGLLNPKNLASRRNRPSEIVRKDSLITPGDIVETRRPRTKEEAQARLGKLDEALNPLADQIAQGLHAADTEFGKGAPKRAMTKEEWVRQRHGKSGAETALPPEDQALWEKNMFGYTQAEAQFQKGANVKRSPAYYKGRAEEILSQIAGNKAEFPVDLQTLLDWHKALTAQGVDMRKLRRAVNEQSDLRAALADKRSVEQAFGEAPVAAQDYGTTVTRTRGPAKVAEAPPGRAYLGYGKRSVFDRLPLRPFTPRVDVPPRKSAALAGSLKSFEGKNLRSANYEHNTSEVAASGMAAMNRYHIAVRLNKRLYAAGVDARPADTLRTKYVPIAEKQLPAQAMETLRQVSQKLDDGVALHGAEKVAYERALHDLQLPEVALFALNDAVGVKTPGVRWVPKSVFDRVTEAGQTATSVPQHPTTRVIKKTWQEFNAGMRGLVLYQAGGGAAYITPNLAANVLLLGFQGGPKIIPAAMRALNPKFRRAVGEDAWQAALARMGEGFMTSTFADQAGAGPVSAVTKAWSRKLGRVTDQETRMISLVYEAGQRGYRSPKQFADLMLNPKRAHEAMDVTIRARDAALDYELMSPAERSAIASWVFVYPFIRASTRYSVNFPLDHPFQAAVYSQLANIANGNQELGNLTDLNAGLVKVGTEKVPGAGTLPSVVNVNAVSPFQAGPDAITSAASFFNPAREPDRGRSLLDLANPAASALISTLAGVDPFTQRPVSRNIGGFAGQVAAQIPAVRDIRQAQKTPAQLARQVTPRTPADILKRQVLGSVAPKPYNVKKAAEYAQFDKTAKKPAPIRARVRVFRERQQVLEALKAHNPERLQKGRLPAVARQAFNRKAEVEAARAAATKASGGDPVGYRREVLYREARLFESWGVVPKGTAADVKRIAATASLDQLDTALRRLRDGYATKAYRDVTGAADKYVKRYQG